MKKHSKLVFGLVLLSVLSSGFTFYQNITEERTQFWNNWINKCFPDKNWDTSTFKTIGVSYTTFKTTDSLTYKDMKALNPNEVKLQEVVESGATMPHEITIKKGAIFYKIVPKGNNINSASVYYLSQSQLSAIKNKPAKLEQTLCLPLSSVAAAYDVFKITFMDATGYVFQSRIAPSIQFANATPTVKYTTSGGGVQTLILDNTNAQKWHKSTSAISAINPNMLPQIGKQ